MYLNITDHGLMIVDWFFLGVLVMVALVSGIIVGLAIAGRIDRKEMQRL